MGRRRDWANNMAERKPMGPPVGGKNEFRGGGRQLLTGFIVKEGGWITGRDKTKRGKKNHYEAEKRCKRRRKLRGGKKMYRGEGGEPKRKKRRKLGPENPRAKGKKGRIEVFLQKKFPPIGGPGGKGQASGWRKKTRFPKARHKVCHFSGGGTRRFLHKKERGTNVRKGEKKAARSSQGSDVFEEPSPRGNGQGERGETLVRYAKKKNASP